MAKTIIDNCIKKKTPKTSNLYLLTSHIRISTDEKYIKRIEELIEKLKYCDISSGAEVDNDIEVKNRIRN